VALLELKNVSVQFGGVIALDNFNLRVGLGEVHGLIGPNGAGKTTALNVISGLIPRTSGTVEFRGMPMAGRAHTRARLGISRTFQKPAICSELSVLENVAIGAYSTTRSGLLQGVLRTPHARHEERHVREMAQRLLRAVDFPYPTDLDAAKLPLGAQRLVEVARAFMAKPRLVLMDEPTSGMDQDSLQTMTDLIRRARELTGYESTVLLVEHNVPFVLRLCDRVTGMSSGRSIASDTSDAIRKNRAVIDAYLGESSALDSVATDVTVISGDHGSSAATLASRGVEPGQLPEVLAPESPPILELRSLTSGYGNATILRDVNLVVRAGQIAVLVGRNGAGKSTLLETVMGVVPAQAGEIIFGGRPRPGMHASTAARIGISLVRQSGGTFPTKSVTDNLVLSTSHLHLNSSGLRDAISPIFDRFPQLAERRTQLAGSLSGGERQMLSIGRALIQRPKVLLLDEPSIGLAPLVVAEVGRVIANLRDEGLGILIAEQNVSWLSHLADVVYFVEDGRVERGSGPADLMSTDRLTHHYLGRA
jgi:branched-chain amino acid transport system ATP-binding protein